MPNILQVAVPTQNAALVWPSRASGVNSLLFINQDLNNYVWIGQESSITAAGPNTIPLAPNGTFSGDASSAWYVVGNVAGTQSLVVVPNGQAYFLGLTQGMGQLAIPSVRSPNFETGVQGWQIAKDGSAEFNDLTIRGTFFGTDFVINSLGGFYYSGTPALGNLIASITSAAGSNDGEGNAFEAGFTVYDSAAYIQMHVNMSGPYPAVEMVSGLGSEYSHPAIYTQPLNAGAANESEQLAIVGPASTFDHQQPAIWAQGAAKDGSSTAGVFASQGGGFTGRVPVAVTDTTLRTINSNNIFAAITPNWGIPANDAKVGTLYRITVLGAGTQVAAAPPFFLEINGFNATGKALSEIAGASIFVGGISIIAEGWIQIQTTGVSGTAMMQTRLTISGNGQAATPSNSIVVNGRAVSVPIDTTALYGISMMAAIGTAAGANANFETSTLERIGP